VSLLSLRKVCFLSLGKESTLPHSVSDDVQVPHNLCSAYDSIVLVRCANDCFDCGGFGTGCDIEIAGVAVDERRQTGRITK
jgi:hypothetical protein